MKSTLRICISVILFCLFSLSEAVAENADKVEKIDLGSGQYAELVLQSEKEMAIGGDGGFVEINSSSGLRKIPVRLKAYEYQMTLSKNGFPVRYYYYQLTSLDSDLAYTWGMWGSYNDHFCLFHLDGRNYFTWVTFNIVSIAEVSKSVGKSSALIEHLSTGKENSLIARVPAQDMVSEDLYKGGNVFAANIKMRKIYFDKEGDLTVQFTGENEDKIYTLVRENGKWRSL